MTIVPSGFSRVIFESDASYLDTPSCIMRVNKLPSFTAGRLPTQMSVSGWAPRIATCGLQCGSRNRVSLFFFLILQQYTWEPWRIYIIIYICSIEGSRCSSTEISSNTAHDRPRTNLRSIFYSNSNQSLPCDLNTSTCWSSNHAKYTHCPTRNSSTHFSLYS